MTKTRPVIYAIRNTVNGKRYIGSTVSLADRKKKHLADLRRGRHHSEILQRAFLKYGEGAFVFEVLEEVSDPSRLLAVEQLYLDTRPEYNISFVAGEKTRLGMKATPQHSANMSAALMGRPGSNLGKKFSEETRRKMSENHKGGRGKGYQHKPESIEKMKIKRRTNPSRPSSPESRERVSESLKRHWAAVGVEERRVHGEKTAAKLRGRKMSEEQKEWLRTHPAGGNIPGSKRSPEARENIAAALRKYHHEKKLKDGDPIRISGPQVRALEAACKLVKSGSALGVETILADAGVPSPIRDLVEALALMTQLKFKAGAEDEG